VVDEIAEETFGVMVPALASAGTPQERITRAVTGVIARFAEDPGKARVAFIEALGSEAVMKRRLAIMRALADLIADQLGRAYPEIEDESFLRFAAFGLVGLLVELMIAWTTGELTASQDELAQTTSELVVATIDGAVAVARGRRAAPQSSPARTWP
jgi:hypothetical protein